MTTGQIMFYAGAALLAITVILAIIFMIKKPRYNPENAAIQGDGTTAPLRNGYPTQPMTVRYPKPEPTQSQYQPAASAAPAGETAVLSGGTALLTEETELLVAEETTLLRADETTVL